MTMTRTIITLAPRTTRISTRTTLSPPPELSRSQLQFASWRPSKLHRHRLSWMRQKHSIPSCQFSSLSNDDAKKDLILTDLNEETGIATLTMNRPPANSLSFEMFQAFSAAIQEIESNDKIECMIVASNLSSIFCAGLDLHELYKPNPTRLRMFWSSFQQLYIDLYGSRLACIAAIHGHAPAGGCMIALCCDYRIMTARTTTIVNRDEKSDSTKKKVSNGKIGLNESQFGLICPPWMVEQYRNTIGHRNAELGLSLGLLYDPKSAKEIGLIDEILTIDLGATDRGNQLSANDLVLNHAQDYARTHWTHIPSQARVGCKRAMRQTQMDKLVATREEDIEQFCSFVTTEQVQTTLGAYLEKLKSK